MRYLIKFSYDGSNFSGYQTQKGKRTVEEELVKAATKINNDKKTNVIATGRTDKKVHALVQYAHLDIDVSITPYKLKRALNSYLSDDIHIIGAYKVKDNFHARFLVKRKTYKYLINMGEYDPIERNYIFQYNYKLNVDMMKDAIKYFIGEHDFRAFVTENTLKSNCIRKIYSANIKKKDNILTITFTGNGFMRYQVRNMVGILIRVGEEKIDPSEVKKILESKSRKENGVTARAEGLYLVDIKYSNLDKYIID